MTDRPRSRQALYERIRATSRDEFILEDMIRLGFWPRSNGRPGDPAGEIQRKAEVLRELRALQTEGLRLQNEEALRAEARKRRIEASRERQRQTRARREAERQDRAATWKGQKQGELLWLGEGVSSALSLHEADPQKLAAQGLPLWSRPADLARDLGLSLSQLRWLCYHRPVSRHSHYHRFRMPKKTGGERLISAPAPRLKVAQTRLAELLNKAPLHPAAHGFVPGRSIVTNAAPHVGAAVVVNLDLLDFFPTIHWRRARGLFRALGCSGAVSTCLALLCTEAPLESVEVDGQLWHVHTGERRLPQGAPTSPVLTNLLCRALDRRLTAVAEGLGFAYTRYADDLTFSSREAEARVGRLLRRVRDVLRQQGLTEHPTKTRVLRSGRRQEVTGLVVNQKLGVAREELRRFRALLHQLESRGPKGLHWKPGAELWSSAAGFASFVAMVDPERGAPLVARVEVLRSRHGGGPAPTPAPTPPAAPAAPAPRLDVPPAPPIRLEVPPPVPAPDAPPAADKPWWKIF